MNNKLNNNETITTNYPTVRKLQIIGRYMLSGWTTTPGLDSEIIIQKNLNCDRAGYVKSLDLQVTEDQFLGTITDFGRRVEGECIAYIINRKEFWKNMFYINKDVLVPRPDTELIIETTLKHFTDKQAPLRILELGTGSGCLGLSLLREYKKAHCTAVDVSPKALEVAMRNAKSMRVSKRVTFLESNWCESIPEDMEFDLIVSNPPYISDEEYESLSKQTKFNDPQVALCDNKDGYRSYVEIIKSLKPKFINSNTLLIFEHGYNQSGKLGILFADLGYITVENRKDLAGHNRVIVIKKKQN